jgi:hypothetical protein
MIPYHIPYIQGPLFPICASICRIVKGIHSIDSRSCNQDVWAVSQSVVEWSNSKSQ